MEETERQESVPFNLEPSCKGANPIPEGSTLKTLSPPKDKPFNIVISEINFLHEFGGTQYFRP